MIYRRLGRTGLHVSLLSLGSWVTFDWQLDTAAAKTIIGAAYDAGINFFDTAEAYAYGKSEEILGRAVKELGLPRENIVISTKLYHGASKTPPPTARGLSRKHIIEGCKGNIQLTGFFLGGG
jgi:aryl-alcohol dehydrogenase-like predicted oxidoreductase